MSFSFEAIAFLNEGIAKPKLYNSLYTKTKRITDPGDLIKEEKKALTEDPEKPGDFLKKIIDIWCKC
jgi:hypothetical protein